MAFLCCYLSRKLWVRYFQEAFRSVICLRKRGKVNKVSLSWKWNRISRNFLTAHPIFEASIAFQDIRIALLLKGCVRLIGLSSGYSNIPFPGRRLYEL